jgi:predicted RNA binding protein YcfA (HicA-like mRNA interferase family)
VKLPRDVTGARLAAALEELGYRFVRQRGSHIHLVTERFGEHHVVVPDHRPVKPGTLNQLLKQVAEHHGMTRDELIDRLKL